MSAHTPSINAHRKMLASKVSPDECHLGLHVFKPHVADGDSCQCGWKRFHATLGEDGFILACRRLLNRVCVCEVAV